MNGILLKGDTPSIMFPMVSATDGNTPDESAASLAVTILKRGVDGTGDSAFSTATDTAAHIDNGWYEFELTATETNTEGWLIIEASATDDAVTRQLYQVVTTLADYIADDDLQVTLSQASQNAIADSTLRRSTSNAEAASGPDTLGLQSLLGSVSKSVHKVSTSGSTVTIYRSNGTTTLGTLTVTTSASADQITAQT